MPDIYTQMLMNLLSQGGYGGGLGTAMGMSPYMGVPQQGGYGMMGRPQQGGYGMQMPPQFFGRGFGNPWGGGAGTDPSRRKQGPPQQGGYGMPHQGTQLTQFRNRPAGPQKRTGGGIEPVGGKKYYAPGSMIHLGDTRDPGMQRRAEEEARRQRGGGSAGRAGGPWGSVYGY